MKTSIRTWKGKTVVAGALACASLFIAQVSFAQTGGTATPQKGVGATGIRAGLQSAGAGSGLETAKPLEAVIGGIINSVLGLIGVLLLAYLLYGGYKYMTSAGDSKDAAVGKEVIKNAIIGIVIIVASFSIADFVLKQLITITGGTTQGGTIQSPQ